MSMQAVVTEADNGFIVELRNTGAPNQNRVIIAKNIAAVCKELKQALEPVEQNDPPF